jgi:GT2 family glycosyltransferase
MSSPRISVLIATADRPELLADCLSHLRRSPFEGVEIIVLDQSRELPHREPDQNSPSRWWRHLHCSRRGKSAALNRGIAEARGELLAFTDDDCRVSENWLEEMHRAFVETRGESALTGKVLAGEREGGAVIAPSLLDDCEEREYRRPAFRDVLFGNNMAIPAPILRRVGPFDESLGPGTPWPAAEDNDLGFRLLRSRVPIRYLPNLVVTHRSWRQASQQQGLFRDYGIGQGAFYGKHARRGNLHMVARMARSLWDGGRDAAGAAVLGRSHDLRASLYFAGGLVRGFMGATLSGAGSPGASLRAEKS